MTQGRVPQALSDFIMNLIARAPGERPAHARDARRVLADLKEHAGPAWHTPVHPAAAQVPPASSGAARASAALARVTPWLRGRRPWPWAVLGGGLVLAGLLATLSAVLRPPSDESGAASPPLAAKQTNHSAPLPSALPTQKETSPTVNPPDTAPQPPAPPAPQTPKATTRRALSLAEKCTLAIATAAWLKLGCAGVQLRPEPDDCPKKSIRAMQDLGWSPSDQGAFFVVLDVNQPPPRALATGGPPFSVSTRTAPSRERWGTGTKRTPKGTTLEGHLWTSGDQVYGRYLWANVPGKGRVPICVELGQWGDVGIRKEPGSKPGAVIVPRREVGFPTREWH